MQLHEVAACFPGTRMTPDVISRREFDVCKYIGWNFRPLTPIDFIATLSHESSLISEEEFGCQLITDNDRHEACRLVVISFQDHRMLHYDPCTVAQACLIEICPGKSLVIRKQLGSILKSHPELHSDLTVACCCKLLRDIIVENERIARMKNVLLSP